MDEKSVTEKRCAAFTPNPLAPLRETHWFHARQGERKSERERERESVVETCCREVSGEESLSDGWDRRVAEKCCRDVVEKCWRRVVEVLEKSVGEKCCRNVW